MPEPWNAREESEHLQHERSTTNHPVLQRPACRHHAPPHGNADAANGQNGIHIVVIWPIAAGVELVTEGAQDKDILGFTLETAHPIAWSLNDGSTLTGDRFRITPEQHGEISATLETLELRAAS